MALDLLLEQFDGLIQSPADVKKLEQTILQWAVMGRLVPQNPNDEPASVLLERITAEKARLVREKKIRKGKKLPPMSDEKIPFDLPSGWTSNWLGNISLAIHYGYTASADPSLRDVRLLRITDIQNNRVNWSTVPGCSISEKKIQRYELANDDILIARTGGTR